MTDTAIIDEKRRRRGRLQLVLLGLLFAMPVLLGTWMYYFSPPSGRTNYGTLIEPQISLPALTGRQLDGASMAPRPWARKWWLVSFQDGPCDDACATQLYIMRQLRLIQGKDADEIERLMFLQSDAAPDQRVLAAYQGNLFIHDSKGAFSTIFKAAGAGTGDLKGHIFLVDPLGNLMMRYPQNPDVEKMKKDIGKLIRLSAGWVRTSNSKGTP